MPLTPAQLDVARAALSAALDGSGPPVEFTEDGWVLARPEARDPARGGGAGVVAVVRTSGSTGTPKQTLLTRDALAASAAATAARIGGEGQWLLAVGLHYVAGLAVLSRSLRAGTTPVPLDAGPFTTRSFAAAVDRLERGSGFRTVSLVPTQLARLLGVSGHDDGRSGIDALRTFDAVLVGGARVPDAVRAAAAEEGIRLRLTYGMSETCGGCVYDGVPLDGVTAELVGADSVGAGSVAAGSEAAGTAAGGTAAEGSGTPRLRLSGPMVAAGYLDDPERTAAHFGTHARAADEGARWFLTEDTGTVAPHPQQPGRQLITVTGRVDDVINTGGVKVSAARVQQVLESLPSVGAAFVGGVPDPEWGQRVCAAVAAESSFDASAARELLRRELGSAAVPKTWVVLDELPLLPNGKTDRQALLARFRTTS